MISSCYLSKEKRLQVEMKAFREVAIYNAAGRAIALPTYLLYKLLLTNFSRKVAHFPHLNGQRVGLLSPFWLDSYHGKVDPVCKKVCTLSSNFGTPYQNVQF